MAKMDFAWGPFRSGDLPGLLREVPPAPHPVLSGGQYVPAEPAQLRWVVLGGKLFATVPIAAGKWNELNAHQLIAGTEICVDGLRFLVRLPVFGYDTDILTWNGVAPVGSSMEETHRIRSASYSTTQERGNTI